MAPPAEPPLPRVSTEATLSTQTGRANRFNRIREALPGPGYFSFHTASSTSTVNLEEPEIVIYGRARDKIEVPKVERKGSRDDTDREPSNTVLFWLCSTIALKGVATQLLFACQKALQKDLNFQLSHFAALTTMQMLLTNLAGPLWAILADRGTLQKKTILIVGCLGEGISATCFAFVPNFEMMMVVRAFSGFFLAALRPVCNGIVADLTSENQRGKVFGRVQGALLFGMFVSDLIAVNMANQSYWLPGANRDLPGWRFLFAAAGVLGMSLALLLRFFLVEPPSRRDMPELPDGEVKPASFLTVVGQELCAVMQFLRMPTFLILVFIGIFATIPWTVFGQNIFFFQLCGLKDWQVSMLPAANKATAMLGTILGGRIGDCFARLGRFGRPLCAQLALAIAIPVMFAMFYGLPPGEGMFWAYFVLIVIFSIFGFWPQCATNLPILSGIVPAEHSSKVMAWQGGFENCLAYVVGPPLMSVLSKAFGYRVRLESDDVDFAESYELDLERARALGKAMAATMCIPWIIAMVAYTCLYWSYPRDMGKLLRSLMS